MKNHVHIIAAIIVLLLAIGITGANASPNLGTISVTPNTGLADGQIVQITGSGFRSNINLFFAECGPVDTKPFAGGRTSATCSDSFVTATTDANGSFTTSLTVSTLVVGTVREQGKYVPATYDCAPLNDCHIHVNSQTGGTVINLDISFGP
jgi:neocarzinostatin family protein